MKIEESNYFQQNEIGVAFAFYIETRFMLWNERYGSSGQNMFGLVQCLGINAKPNFLTAVNCVEN